MLVGRHDVDGTIFSGAAQNVTCLSFVDYTRRKFLL